MTAVVHLEEPTRRVVQAEDEREEQDRGALPLRGLAGLGGSAIFAMWTSLTCFVC